MKKYCIYIIYILRSLRNGRFYTGSTDNLERRLFEHNSGWEKSTKYIRPLELVFSAAFPTLAEARSIERKIKRLKRRDIIEKILADGVIRLGR